MSGVSVKELQVRQSLPLHMKVALTQSAIMRWYEHFDGQVYLSYSGGKDSTVLLEIVKGLYPDVPAVFCDTGLEYPEVRELALRKSDVVLRPKMNFKQVIEKYGYPFPSKEQALYIDQYRHTKSEKLRDYRWNGWPPNGSFAIAKKWRFLVDAPFEVSGKCCDVMKKAPFHAYERESGRKPMIATMAEESRLRMQEYLQHACNSYDAKRSKSTPLGFWTEQDVLRYLKENGTEYASCYGDIVDVGGGVARAHWHEAHGLHVLHVRCPVRRRSEQISGNAARLPEAVRLLHQQARHREGARLRGNPVRARPDAVRQH